MVAAQGTAVHSPNRVLNLPRSRSDQLQLESVVPVAAADTRSLHLTGVLNFLKYQMPSD